MRLFLAIDLPSELKDKLEKLAIEKQIKTDLHRREKFHITLVFIGDRDLNEIINKLKDFSFKSFQVKLTGQPDIPHVNGFAAAAPELIPLMKQVYELLEIPMKDLKPHVTLSEVELLNEKASLTETFEFNADKILLINSTITPEGHVYSTLKEFNAVN